MKKTKVSTARLLWQTDLSNYHRDQHLSPRDHGLSPTDMLLDIILKAKQNNEIKYYGGVTLLSLPIYSRTFQNPGQYKK